MVSLIHFLTLLRSLLSTYDVPGIALSLRNKHVNPAKSSKGFCQQESSQNGYDFKGLIKVN